MSTRSYNTLYGNQAKSVESPAGYSKEVKLVQFMMQEYGGVNFAINVIDSLVEFAKRFRKSDKKYQMVMTLLKYGTPAAILTSDLVSKYRKYCKIKAGDDNVHNEKETKIFQLLGIDKPKNCHLFQTRLDLGRDVSYWIFEKPDTKAFKIKAFHEYENLGGIQDIWKIESGNVFVTIEYRERMFVWNFSFQKYDGELTVHSSDMTTIYKADCDNNHMVQELKREIFKEFLNSFDTRKNVLYYYFGLHGRERHPPKREINQFNIDKFAKEIRKVLDRKKKRGYVFVGVPGVGKSSIIRELEAIITEYPIIYLPAGNFTGQALIRDTFSTLAHIQPCIAILEDIDSFDFKEKNSSLGAFLDEIDDVNKKLNIVFIATVNDTDLVHYSLINRPGRLDQVIMLHPPSTKEDIYHVMNVCYGKQDKEIAKTPFMTMQEIQPVLFDAIMKSHFTQADICEIIEKGLLLSDIIDNDVLMESTRDLVASKEAIRKCNFSSKNPYGDQGCPTPDVTEAQLVSDISEEISTMLKKDKAT